MGIKLGNGKWATKEDELLAYRVIEGKYFNRSFDFARSSTTTRVNKDGYIEDVPSDTARIDFADSVDGALLTEPASTNLITYPITFGDDYWIKSGATIEGDSTLTLTGTDVASGWDFTSGWTASGTASIDSATSFTLNAASDYVNKKYNTLTGDAVLLRIVGTKDGGTLDIRDRDGTSGSNYAITDNTFDVTFWMNYTSSREPLMFHAADGHVGQVNITTLEFYEAQGFAAPKVDGSGDLEREAYKLVEDTANSRHRCTTDNILTSSGNAHTLSVYAKADTRNWIALELYGVGDRMAWFDLANGVVGTKQANITSSEIVAMANGWYRCSITLDAPGSQGMFGVFVADEDDSYSYTGENKSVYLSYLQVEESDYASSLMLPVTEGSTTSRVADACTGSGTAQDFKDYNASGVLYAEIAALSQSGDDVRISISNGSETDRLSMSYTGVTNEIQLFMNVGGSTQANEKVTLTNVTSFSKIAARWAENDISLWADGVEVATDTSASTFAANILSVLNFNYCVAPYNAFYGKTRGLEVLPYMSDTEMVTLTT